MLQVQGEHKEHGEFEDSEILAFEKAENETKNEDFFLDIDETDLEPEVYDDLDDWILLDHEPVVSLIQESREIYLKVSKLFFVGINKHFEFSN